MLVIRLKKCNRKQIFVGNSAVKDNSPGNCDIMFCAAWCIFLNMSQNFSKFAFDMAVQWHYGHEHLLTLYSES